MSTRPKTTVKFLKFNRDNPHVYRELTRLTHTAKGHRGGQISIKLVYEGLRWETYTQTNGDPYRFSNSFTAYYARLIMHLNPDLRGVFTLRPSVADEDACLVDADQIALWHEAQRNDGWLEEAARAVEDTT